MEAFRSILYSLLCLYFIVYVAGDSTPGEVSFGYQNRSEFVAGNLPVIIVVPHGGRLRPDSIPDRNASWGIVEEDTNTYELGKLIYDEFVRKTGAYPFAAFCLLHRTKLDANRDITEAAQYNEEAEITWREIHTWINETATKIVSQFGFGQLFDIHGQSHAIEIHDIGMGLSIEALNSNDTVLSNPENFENCTIRNLAHPSNFSELIRGPKSLGGLLQARNRNAMPSPANPHPNSLPYFNGNWGIRAHGSGVEALEYGFTGGYGKVGAIQVEVHRSVRIGVSQEVMREFSSDLVDAILEWMDIWYPPWKPVTPTPPEPHSDTSSNFAFVILICIAVAVIVAVLTVILWKRWRYRNQDNTHNFQEFVEEFDPDLGDDDL